MSKAERERYQGSKPKGDIDESYGLRVEEEILSAPAGEILRRQTEKLTLLQNKK